MFLFVSYFDYLFQVILIEEFCRFLSIHLQHLHRRPIPLLWSPLISFRDYWLIGHQPSSFFFLFLILLPQSFFHRVDFLRVVQVCSTKLQNKFKLCYAEQNECFTYVSCCLLEVLDKIVGHYKFLSKTKELIICLLLNSEKLFFFVSSFHLMYFIIRHLDFHFQQYEKKTKKRIVYVRIKRGEEERETKMYVYVKYGRSWHLDIVCKRKSMKQITENENNRSMKTTFQQIINFFFNRSRIIHPKEISLRTE